VIITREKIILGIDPGTNIMGYGVISATGSSPKLMVLGVLDMRKIDDPYLKVRKIFDTTLRLIEQYHPDELAIEAPFYGKNVQSMLKLGRAQGVAMAAALSREVPVFEYAPRKIKMAITGQGNASKEQVAAMLRIILDSEEAEGQLDATDGLAAAVCHFLQPEKTEKGEKHSSWKSFLRDHPDRLHKT